jgi:hypothetical protein
MRVTTFNGKVEARENRGPLVEGINNVAMSFI